MIGRQQLARRAAAGLAAWALVSCGDGSVGTGEDGAGGPAPRAVAPETLAGLAGTIAELRHRASLIRDANDIRRLQRIYGYYLDNGLWSEVADLFAADGTIEIGLDGVYEGPERIREYLGALGAGDDGLPAGRLNEHMQLMPVVTVAPDGRTAKGRWRDLMLLGQFGQSAHWGEGPQENEYVKENGVWKLSKVHWYQSVVVPYETGWQTTPDSNGGHWVPESMTPDRPPSTQYGVWPGTYLPPFHFPNPVLDGTPVGQLAAAAAAPPAGPQDLETLAREAAVLTQQLSLLEDENAIENLQRIYGFYIEEGFWSAAADLFADDGTIEIGGSGVYVGRERVRAYLRTLGAEFPQEGRLFDRMQLQPVVHVAPDGRTAKARWRLFAQEAQHGEFARWGVGVYENTYVKVDGTWRIRSLHGFPKMYTNYADGWGVAAIPDAGPSQSLPPDRPSTVVYERYPAEFVVPFHFGHPVTGEPVYEQSPADFAPAAATGIAELESTLGSLRERVTRLEDFDALERLNAVYGYYLARNEWDNLTGIFAPDGTIEIALRGVYAGRQSVRRNLDLYGERGIHHGFLHNHMQYQPVIHIAEDGSSAQMRSRAFSIMGQYDAYAMWMGGIYENVYVKEDGIWQIETDHQINTYFVPYAIGWKDAPPRPPPGITDANPPDSPPTLLFEMYPSAFLPPYHYRHPVTGEQIVWEANR